MKTAHTLVIGAGIGGLTVAAILLQAGHRITVLEAQNYVGGCAGTFTYRGYRFDAGATLAGGFAEGGPHARLAKQLGLEWPIVPVESVAWDVHLPDGRTVRQWVDGEQWREEWRKAFVSAEKFWRTQEKLADIAWDTSTRHFPWPPESFRDVVDLGRAIRPRTLLALPHLFATMRSLLPTNKPMLKTFVDANLLIAAQTISDDANALYGSAALDLPRRGVNTVKGGIGALAETLAEWIRAYGGEIVLRQEVSRIEVEGKQAVGVVTNEGNRRRKVRRFSADTIVANTTPWGLNQLLGRNAPASLNREIGRREATWGAFMVYAGVRADQLPENITDHHLVVRDHTQPLGETNSLFVSLSDDPTRAPAGMRAVNISTHTKIGRWWQLRDDPKRKNEYHELRDQYTEQMLEGAERAVAGLGRSAELILPATPITYEHWTGRPQGMVGGFPQTSLLKARGPRTPIANVWLVGDSVFPGQSTAGATLGGMRVANTILTLQ